MSQKNLKTNLWWILPTINLVVFLPHLLGIKASMCDNVVYAIIGQILLFPAFFFIWGAEKTFQFVIPDAVTVLIATAFYMFLGWGIGKVWKDHKA